MSFVLILPFGYYTDSADTADMAIGIHGGTGQVASVIRGCEGNVLDSEASPFKDVSGSAEMAVPPGKRSPLRVGIRAGYWESNARFAISAWDYYPEYDRSSKTKVCFSYFNPNVSLESKYWGVGFGYLFGDVVQSFDDYGPGAYYEYDKIRFSMHTRIGNLDKGYFACSFAESTPLISGGGPLDLGVGYRVHPSVYLYSGMSAVFYGGVGYLQQARVNLGRGYSCDASVRLGGVKGAFEPAVSVGVVYAFRLSPKPRHSP